MKDKLQGIGPHTQALHLGASSPCVNIVFIQKHELRGEKVVYLGKCVWKEDNNWNNEASFGYKINLTIWCKEATHVLL